MHLGRADEVGSWSNVQYALRTRYSMTCSLGVWVSPIIDHPSALEQLLVTVGWKLRKDADKTADDPLLSILRDVKASSEAIKMAVWRIKSNGASVRFVEVSFLLPRIIHGLPLPGRYGGYLVEVVASGLFSTLPQAS